MSELYAHYHLPQPQVMNVVHRPVSPGYYWFCGAIEDQDEQSWQIVHYDTSVGVPLLTLCGTDIAFGPEDLRGEFVGPLAEPRS